MFGFLSVLASFDAALALRPLANAPNELASIAEATVKNSSRLKFVENVVVRVILRRLQIVETWLHCTLSERVSYFAGLLIFTTKGLQRSWVTNAVEIRHTSTVRDTAKEKYVPVKANRPSNVRLS